MKTKYFPEFLTKKWILKSAALFSLMLFVSLYGKETQTEVAKYLEGINPDILQLLPSPPLDGSAEQKAELGLLRTVTAKRTKAEFAASQSQILLDFFTYSPVIGEWFKKDAFPKTYALFLKVEKTTKFVTNKGKNYWKRKRPYESDSSIKVIKKEESFSYPSGHSSRGMVYATVLAELFPDKKEELLAFGRNVGWNRMVAGVHYPSDVNAGRILGMAIARELLKNQQFLIELEEVKEEIKSAMVK